jgi:hypothetical protein
MLAGIQGRLCHWGVQGIGDCNGDCINVGIGQQVFRVRISLLKAVCLGEFTNPLSTWISSRNHFGLVMRVDTLAMILGYCTGSNHAYFDSLHHYPFFPIINV